MDPKPIISVIIPVYNVAPWLDECIESVVGQTYQNLEILIVNDGSTDSSGQLCEKWVKTDSRIKLFVQENAGLSAARNTALRNATGEYYLFVDSDDYIEPNIAERLYCALITCNADIAMCGYYAEFSTSTAKFCSDDSCVMTSTVFLEHLLRGQGSATDAVWNKLYPAKLFKDASFIEGRTFEDVAILPSLISQCNRIVELPNCLYRYRVRENSITDTMTMKNLECRLQSHSELENYINRECPHLHDSVSTYQLRNDIVLWSHMNLVIGAQLQKQQHKASLRKRIKTNKSIIRGLETRLHIAGYLILYCPHIYGFLFRLYYRLRRYRREKVNGNET